MKVSTLLILIGLALVTTASLVMLWSYLDVKKNVDDDLIVYFDENTGEFTQSKHLKDRKFGIVGFIFFSLGFLFQFGGIILSTRVDNDSYVRLKNHKITEYLKTYNKK